MGTGIKVRADKNEIIILEEDRKRYRQSALKKINKKKTNTGDERSLKSREQDPRIQKARLGRGGLGSSPKIHSILFVLCISVFVCY